MDYIFLLAEASRSIHLRGHDIQNIQPYKSLVVVAIATQNTTGYNYVSLHTAHARHTLGLHLHAVTQTIKDDQ